MNMICVCLFSLTSKHLTVATLDLYNSTGALAAAASPGEDT